MKAIQDRPLRKSRRYETSQRVKTSRLRRIRDLFWMDDDIYSNEVNKDDDDDGDGDDDDEVDATVEKSFMEKKKNKDVKRSCPLQDADNSNNNDVQSCPSSSTMTKGVDFNFGGRLRLQRVHSSPHIYTIHDFLTPREFAVIQEKICVAHEKKMFHHSFVDVGGMTTTMAPSRKRNRNDETTASNNTTTITQQRTSTFIHFSKLSNSVIASIENRAADLLLLPNHSIEPLQLVRYSKGQYFHDHHDLGVLFDDGTVELPKKSALTPPRRIVTVLVYLNDLPDGSGGSTQFPLLNNNQGNGCLSIRPKKNMAVVWCNLLKNGMPDHRVVHRGEIIKKECFKYAINIWACED